MDQFAAALVEASHPGTPPERLRELLTDPGLLQRIPESQRFAIAANPGLTEDALRLLSSGSSLRLRQLISLRHDLSEEFLLTLADQGVDVDRLLRARSAGAALWCKAVQVRHQSLPSQNQIFLSRERDLPKEALRLLEQEPDEEVAQSLRWRQESPLEQQIPQIEYSGAVQGRASGTDNEDRCATFHNQTVGLFVVADGLSGAAHTGHIAAEKICQTLMEELAKVHGPLHAQDFFHHSFYKAFHEIARSVHHSHDFSQYFHGHWFDTNGVAASVAALLLQGRCATIAHIGDCRVYLQRGGQLVALTRDHNLLWYAAKSGQSLPSGVMANAHKILVRVLGYDGVGATPTLTRVEVRSGDRLLLASDGVHGTLSEQKLSEIVQNHSVRDAVRQLMKASQQAGGTDDLAAVVVAVL